MTGVIDFLMLTIILLDLYCLATNRIEYCISATAIQGTLFASLLFVFAGTNTREAIHFWVLGTATAIVKGILIPKLLRRALRVANVRRDIEPKVSLHVSVLFGIMLVILAFWLGRVLVFPKPIPAGLLLPTAFSTIFIGFLILVSRKKAVTQVVGYLVLENGVFLFGFALIRDFPFVVELAILLDVLVGVFVMGIAIHNIAREFDDIDINLMVSLKE